MKRCKYCNITVDTDKNYCPVCFNRLEPIDDKSTSLYTMRTENETTKIKSTFLTRLFVFLTICSIVVCVLVNLLTAPQNRWFYLVVFGELYVWILIKHTILSKRSLFKKLSLQIISLIIVLYFAEKLSISNWLVPYVYPSVSLGAFLALTLILLISPKRGEYLIGFLVIALLLGILSLVFIIIFPKEFLILNIVNLSVSGVSIVGYFLFGFNAIKSEFYKKWHL